MAGKKKDKMMHRKQVMKMITGHKVPVFIAVAALALFVVIALVLLLNRQGKEQQAAEAEEQGQLTDMAAYLGEIDEVVTTNRERLAEAALFQADTENTLNTFQENLTLLGNSFSQIEAILRKHTEKETVENSGISASITALIVSQQEIKARIAAVDTAISDIISGAMTENEGNFTIAFEKLERLEADLAETKKDMEGYYSSLAKLASQFMEENGSQYEELTDTLLAAQAGIEELLKKGFEDIQLQMDEDFTALIEKLDSLHEQIADTTDSITELLLLMEENDAGRHEEIKAAFASVNESLELIRAEYTDAHMELQGLIQKVQETQNANHEETLSVLTAMESNMEETSLENLSQLTSSLQTMEEKFTDSIGSMQGEMDQSFSNLNTGMENSFLQTNESIKNNFSQTNDSIANSFSQINDNIANRFSQTDDSIKNEFNKLNTDISNQYQNISSTIINNNGSQQESLDNLMDFLNRKLQEVFQFVSNGKKKLASALLTKGVSIREDATFGEIYQAILDIPQKLVIGVQQIPGEISYDYHYHTDAQGRNPHTEVSGSAGGCYTAPIYHVHTGNSNNGGGCYTSPIYHSHSEGCYSEGSHDSSCPTHIGYHSYDCGSVHDWDGDGHGCDGFTVYDCGGHRVISCGLGNGIVGYSLGCGKGNSTVEGYRTACGLVDGQIVGAHIVYDKNALNAVAMAYEEEAYGMSADIQEENTGYKEAVQEVSGSMAETEMQEAEMEQAETEETEIEQTETEDEGIEVNGDIELEAEDSAEEAEAAEDSKDTEKSSADMEETVPAENMGTERQEEE